MRLHCPALPLPHQQENREGKIRINNYTDVKATAECIDRRTCPLARHSARDSRTKTTMSDAAQTQNDNLCTGCSALPPQLLSPGSYAHPILRPNEPFSLIEDSGVRGCQLCILIVDAVTGERNGASLPRKSQGITLAAICKGRYDGEYHALCPEKDHSKALAIRHNGQKIGQLRFDIGGHAQPSAEPAVKTTDLGRAGQTRGLRERADDPSNFALISTWMAECTKKHPDCTTNLVTGFALPARLIDVRPEQSGVEAKLVITAGQQQQGLNVVRPGYAVLSHCWGADSTAMLKTTRANLNEMQNAIKWDALPKTFQDAITITRQLLIRGKGIRYLWIDALCILQDDPEDFAREGTAMHKTYSMATCTIAASASPDSKSGCLLPRGLGNHGSEPRLNPCKTEIGGRNVTVHPWSSEWENAHRGPLSTRGWCFQERELSRRILAFTAHRIVWECRTAMASEDHPAMIAFDRRYPDPEPELTPDRLIVQVGLGSASYRSPSYTSPKTTKLWCRAVQEYTRRNLSYKKDRLPAIYGLAEIVSCLIRDDYAAGLWLTDFARGASWVPNRAFLNQADHAQVGEGMRWPPEAADPSQPSWSWASVDGPVVYPHLESFESAAVDLNSTIADVWNLQAARGGAALTIAKQEGEKGYLQTFGLDVEDVQGEFEDFGSLRNSEVVVKGVVVHITLSETDCTTKFPTPPSVPKAYHMFGKPMFKFGAAAQPGVLNGLVRFDRDPYKLVKQPFVCLRLGWRKNEPGGSLFDEVYLGLVLQPVVKVGMSLAQRVEMDLSLAPEGFSINRHPGMFFRRVGTFEVASGNKKYNSKAKMLRCILV